MGRAPRSRTAHYIIGRKISPAGRGRGRCPLHPCQRDFIPLDARSRVGVRAPPVVVECAWECRAACTKARLAEGEPRLRGSRRTMGAPRRGCAGQGGRCPLVPPLLLWSACAAGCVSVVFCATGTDKHMPPSPPHDRRSMRSLRRPPQEDAASHPHGGGRKHGRSGATVGEPRPSATNQAPFPSGEGVTAVP